MTTDSIFEKTKSDSFSNYLDKRSWIISLVVMFGSAQLLNMLVVSRTSTIYSNELLSQVYLLIFIISLIDLSYHLRIQITKAIKKVV